MLFLFSLPFLLVGLGAQPNLDPELVELRKENQCLKERLEQVMATPPPKVAPPTTTPSTSVAPLPLPTTVPPASQVPFPFGQIPLGDMVAGNNISMGNSASAMIVLGAFMLGSGLARM